MRTHGSQTLRRRYGHAEANYEAFRRANPAIRNFQRFTSDQRASHAASFRLTPRQRQAAGEFFYTHPMLPGLAFPTAKAATTAAFRSRLAP